jgi:hypothetical protein
MGLELGPFWKVCSVYDCGASIVFSYGMPEGVFIGRPPLILLVLLKEAKECKEGVV